MNDNFICYRDEIRYMVWNINKNPHVIHIWRKCGDDDRIKEGMIFIPAYLDEVDKSANPFNLVQDVARLWQNGIDLNPPAKIIADICREDGYEI